MRLKKKDILIILGIFISWRILLFVASFYTTLVIPPSHSLFPYRDTILEPSRLPPWIWSFGNFDGVHFLRITLLGYAGSELSQAFFPVYPVLIWFLSKILNPIVSALVVSNVFLLGSLFLAFEIFRMDFSRKTSLLSTISILAFPTAYYFGSIYSESVFLFFSIGSLYFLRKKLFIFSGFFALVASATRLVGIFLILPMIYELWRSYGNKTLDRENLKRLTGAIMAPVGLLLYILYLKLNFSDPFIFLTSPLNFHTGRTGLFVTPIQVIYRYFKIFVSINIWSLSFFNALLEFISLIFVIFLLFISYKKINRGYWLFVLFASLLPTLTGTLTSMPRYVLVSALLFPVLIEKTGKFSPLLIELCLILEVILLSMFIGGYWVA